MSMKLRVLNAQQVRAALPMAEAIRAMMDAFRQLSTGQAQTPLRTRLEVAEAGGVSLFMPAFMRQSGDLAIKAVSVFPHNADRGLPTIHALVIAFDSQTGAPAALLEGASLTALRTGAASGAATDLLARPDSSVLAVFGSGAQARTQLEAVCCVRPIREVRIFSLDTPSARRLADEFNGRIASGARVRLAVSAEEAVEGADVICTATTSSSPVFPDSALLDGAHVNAIGAFTPEMQEIDPHVVARCRVFVDSRQAALAEAGDLIQPIRSGLIRESSIEAELGEVIAGTKAGRRSAREITLFKSVGLAVQDAVAAGAIVRRAQADGLGGVIDL
jgi:ornithine cyclodeaminase